MTFNSWSFLIFFPVVTATYFMTPQRFQWLVLLISSCIFYMAFVPAYILILAFTIVVDYFAGIWIEGATGSRRRLFLTMSLAANLGVLGVFKYGNFAVTNAAHVARFLGLHYPMGIIEIILPIGLSFHTFQAMSYTIEVYRGNQRAERHFGIYALYVMFYPQLVAGPIERPQNLLPQFREPHPFEGSRVAEGLGRMLWGMLKKIVIADRMAVIVNNVYAHPHDFPARALALATYCFAIQIYADFSAYSDIALGAARVMGFTLMENFDRPLLSKSFPEFWRRWHISLTTWFRDYLFDPIALSTRQWGRAGIVFALMITFLASGLWHGASWTFVFWGGLHGLYLSFSFVTTDIRRRLARLARLERIPRLHHLARVLITFNLFCFASIFFRAADFSQAIYIVQSLARGAWHGLVHGSAALSQLPHPGIGVYERSYLLISLGLLVATGAVHIFRGKQPVTLAIHRMPLWLQWTAYDAMILVILLTGTFGSQSFIYFQF